MIAFAESILPTAYTQLLYMYIVTPIRLSVLSPFSLVFRRPTSTMASGANTVPVIDEGTFVPGTVHLVDLEGIIRTKHASETLSLSQRHQ